MRDFGWIDVVDTDIDRLRPGTIIMLNGEATLAIITERTPSCRPAARWRITAITVKGDTIDRNVNELPRIVPAGITIVGNVLP